MTEASAQTTAVCVDQPPMGPEGIVIEGARATRFGSMAVSAYIPDATVIDVNGNSIQWEWQENPEGVAEKLGIPRRLVPSPFPGTLDGRNQVGAVMVPHMLSEAIDAALRPEGINVGRGNIGILVLATSYRPYLVGEGEGREDLLVKLGGGFSQDMMTVVVNGGCSSTALAFHELDTVKRMYVEAGGDLQGRSIVIASADAFGLFSDDPLARYFSPAGGAIAFDPNAIEVPWSTMVYGADMRRPTLYMPDSGVLPGREVDANGIARFDHNDIPVIAVRMPTKNDGVATMPGGQALIAWVKRQLRNALSDENLQQQIGAIGQENIVCITHQPSKRGMEKVQEVVHSAFPGIEMVWTFGEYGNNASASIPVAILKAGFNGLKRKYHLLLGGFGVGPLCVPVLLSCRDLERVGSEP